MYSLLYILAGFNIARDIYYLISHTYEFTNISKDPSLNEMHSSNPIGYSDANNLKEYWSWVAKDNKQLHKKNTKLISIFEKKASGIKKEYIGKPDIPKSL